LTKTVAPRWALGVGVAFAVLALTQTARALAHHEQSPVVVSGLRNDAQFSMPEEIGGWHRVAADQHYVSSLELRAIYSQVWTYRYDRVVVVLALDYPYAGLHDLALCYRLRGWDLGTKPGRSSDATGNEKGFFEIEMRKKPVTSGYLLYGCVAEDGQWVGEDFNRLVQGRFSGSAATTYQVQALNTSYASLNRAEKQQILQLFLEARQLLAKQVLAQLKREP